ncbi:MAG: PD-(D/E)XK nuclease family protein [Elusimicrobiota bacterium]|jgi:CRISPR/Cas system-associated exonuclease Cas4 (RecB family)|nr:PD-(D/E)XK nuclease family protein [Elusimicrobiota bacterium]
MSTIKRFDFTSVLGWSVSRYDRFLNCKRQYFYDYYSKFEKEIPYEKINFLKSLTSKVLESGNIVHDAIRDVLERLKKSSKPINKDKLFKYVFTMTENYCKSKFFFESYYKKEVVMVPEIFDKVKVCIEEFISSQTFDWILNKAIDQRSEWIIEPEGFGETRIGSLKAYCKVDFLFPIDNKVYIFDWKTGKPNEKKHSKQLTGYSLWAGYHFNKFACDISAAVVYLFPKYNVKKINIAEEDIKKFEQTVEKESNEMYGYLLDVESNIPKDKKEFPINKNKLCDYCNYQELCK